MTVDFLRECYTSTWHLFADRPDVLTAGYYYFSDGAPAYPGSHLFGSRNWNETNWQLVQGLGEDLATKHLHMSGEYDGDRPQPRSVGDSERIAHGGYFKDRAQRCELFDGYPLECFVPLKPKEQAGLDANEKDYIRGTSYLRCPTQRLWAHVIDMTYADRPAMIEETLAAFFELPVTVSYHAGTNTLSACVTVKGKDWAVVAIDGTRNFQQLALQAVESIAGPTNIGGFSTVPLWYTNSDNVRAHMESDGITDDRPLLLVGHSYGAATALVLAARLKHADPARTVKYLTFGCPKIGDNRLVELVSKCLGMSLRNDNDPVCALPADTLSLAPVIGALTAPRLSVWENWQAPPANVTQTSEGKLDRNAPYFIAFDTLKNIAERALNNEPIEDFVGHGIAEYIRRCDVRCPQESFPVCTDLEDIFYAPAFAESVLGMDSHEVASGALCWCNPIPPHLLLEGGSDLLLEDGSLLLLE